MSGNGSWSPVSYILEQLILQLPDAEVLSIQVQDEYYDYSKKKCGWSFLGQAAWRFRRGRIAQKIGARFARADRYLKWLEESLGVPIDQTLDQALAQIRQWCKSDISQARAPLSIGSSG